MLPRGLVPLLDWAWGWEKDSLPLSHPHPTCIWKFPLPWYNKLSKLPFLLRPFLLHGSQNVNRMARAQATIWATWWTPFVRKKGNRTEKLARNGGTVLNS